MVDFVTAMQLAAAKYLFKFIIAVLDTPFIYLARSWQIDSAQNTSDQPSFNRP
ncbi:MAG: uncharacterized PurR-regulated membrane protein YhhQ (DUF165 family) [Arenicella sp.]